MESCFENTVSVVAGGSTGIGRAVVEALTRFGSKVEFVGNGEEEVEALQRSLASTEGWARGSVVDAADPFQVEEFMSQVRDRHGKLDYLVNSIGIQRYGTVETTSVEIWDEVMEVNVRSMFLFAKYAIPLMRRNGSGSVVNVSSDQAFSSQTNVVAYTASKGAIVAMTRAMAVDHASEQIRVNVVCPGSIDTPMLRASAADMDKDDPLRVIEEWGKGHPIGRVGSPEEVAHAICFLLSPYASFITGAELKVDGGLLAGVSLAAPGGASN